VYEEAANPESAKDSGRYPTPTAFYERKLSCPSDIPSLSACCRNAPTVRFIAFEILATDLEDTSLLLTHPRNVSGRFSSA
jgi:hypothetical protein